MVGKAGPASYGLQLSKKVSPQPMADFCTWADFADNVTSFRPGAILSGEVGCVHSGHIKARRGDSNPRADNPQSGYSFSVNRSDPSRRYFFFWYFSYSIGLPVRMVTLALLFISLGLAATQPQKGKAIIKLGQENTITKSLGPRLLVGGPFGLLTSSFTPFGRSGRV